MLRVCADLRASELRCVVAHRGGAIPMHSRSNGLLETPNRPPAEQVVSLISREVEQLGFVRSAGLVPIQPTARPMPQYFFDQLLDRAV